MIHSKYFNTGNSSGSESDTSKFKRNLLLEPIKRANQVRADIDPMSVDLTMQWDSIGGMDDHIKSLKEMVLFPLIFPQVFEKFSIAPPKGVLFFGPPGTGSLFPFSSSSSPSPSSYLYYLFSIKNNNNKYLIQ